LGIFGDLGISGDLLKAPSDEKGEKQGTITAITYPEGGTRNLSNCFSD
jgi:hypothetical protein